LGICGRKKVKKHIMKIKIILFALFLRLKCRHRLKYGLILMIGMPDKTPREVDDGITLIMALKTSD
jgi:pyrimidine-specific ribonucleoside hydrolase